MADTKRSARGSEKRQRTVIVQYRTTAERLVALRTAADARGLSLPAYLREREEGTPGPRSARRRLLPEERAIRQLIGQLGAVGNNLNQLTHLAHLGDIREPRELAPVLQKIEELADACMAAIGRET